MPIIIGIHWRKIGDKQLAKKKKVYVPVQQTTSSGQDNEAVLKNEVTAPPVTPYTTPFSEKNSYIDPVTGKSVMINTGEGIDPTMINEGETVAPDAVVPRPLNLVQRTKQMLLRRFGRKETNVTGGLGLMTPVTIGVAGAFSTTPGASPDVIQADALSQGFVSLDAIEPGLDDYVDNMVFMAQD